MSSGGVHYFFEGFSLIKTKGLKRFVFVPLTINLVLFSVAFYSSVERRVGTEWCGTGRARGVQRK